MWNVQHCSVSSNLFLNLVYKHVKNRIIVLTAASVYFQLLEHSRSKQNITTEMCQLGWVIVYWLLSVCPDQSLMRRRYVTGQPSQLLPWVGTDEFRRSCGVNGHTTPHDTWGTYPWCCSSNSVWLMASQVKVNGGLGVTFFILSLLKLSAILCWNLSSWMNWNSHMRNYSPTTSERVQLVSLV